MSITQSLPSRTSESPGLFRSSSGFSMIWRIFLCIYPDKTALRKSSYLDRHLSVLRVSDVLQTSIDAGVQLIVLTCGALFNFNICSLIFEMMGWGKLIFKPLLIFPLLIVRVHGTLCLIRRGLGSCCPHIAIRSVKWVHGRDVCKLPLGTFFQGFYHDMLPDYQNLPFSTCRHHLRV